MENKITSLPVDLNERAALIHKIHEKWWQNPTTGEKIERDKGEMVMLIITELSEAVEGIRKNLMDDKLPHRQMEEVELADAKIRLLDFSAGFNYKIHKFDTYFPVPKNKSKGLLMISAALCGVIFPMDGSSGMEESYIMNANHFIDSYCRWHGLDLEGAMIEKLNYNMTREDHKHEARLKEGGKRF